jgi:hypothetical protein
MDLADIKVYRITHIQNLSHILQYGITHKRSQYANPDYVSIGDASLIKTRDTKQVTVNNGDILANGIQITLGDFIPFYFGVRMPMLYVIQQGGNFVEKATPPEHIIYVTCKIINIVQLNIEFYFSDGHATDFFSSFYDKSQVENLPDIIDWGAIQAKYWGKDENLDIRRKKQAEFLAGSDIPPHYLFDFGCYNNVVKEQIVSLGVTEQNIQVVPTAYY